MIDIIHHHDLASSLSSSPLLPSYVLLLLYPSFPYPWTYLSSIAHTDVGPSYKGDFMSAQDHQVR
jgi:hypothetical protein